MDIPNNTHGRCDMVKLETALGEITISGEVLETIVGRAVNLSLIHI